MLNNKSLSITKGASMKLYTRAFSFVLFLFFQVDSFSQIPNAGFENWTNEDPDNWITFDFSSFNTVTQSADGHSGSSAKLEIIDLAGNPYFPYLYSNFHVSAKHGSLLGYYKFFPQTDKNIFEVSVSMWSSSGLIGYGWFITNNSVSSFTQFVVPIVYPFEDVPDSATITVFISDSSETGIGGIGSYVLLDDLSFGEATGVQLVNQNPSTFNLQQNYPNPFNPSTKINFGIMEESYVELIIYDLLGREIKKLVSDNYPAGNYSVDFTADNLSGGIYIAKMSAGKYTKAIKMTLLK
jgi:Secretion system C-terminal sorting domain